METKEVLSENEAREATGQIQQDRATLVRRIRHTGVWYHPISALLASIIVWAPAIEAPVYFSMVAALCTVGLSMIGDLRNRPTKITLLARPVGAAGWVILIVCPTMFVGFIAASIALVVTGQPGFTIFFAAATFATVFLGLRLYDEVRIRGTRES